MTKIRVANFPNILTPIPIPCIEIAGDFMTAPITWAALDEVCEGIKAQKPYQSVQYCTLLIAIEEALSFASGKVQANPNPHLRVGRNTVTLLGGKKSVAEIEDAVGPMSWLYEVNLKQIKTIKSEAQQWVADHPQEVEEYLLSQNIAAKILA